MELGVESSDFGGETEDNVAAPTLDAQAGLAAGAILGGRYRLRSLLGRGGMGEVWRATDLKLRVDIALKALREELVSNQRALNSLRQEVRMAREVLSPNVCRVFDLVELDDQELVSMEYIDGMTLVEIFRVRAPLDLTEAREIASQFLAGLEAIHEAGLVHRDVKPENLMMTRSGRVVLMDFGISKGLAEGLAGTLSGTPAYMAPEQARGGAADARADVFSAGIVLAEMIAPDGIPTIEARQALWQGIHSVPPVLPESPWGEVIGRAVARTPQERLPSAAALARALEEVTLLADRADEVQPYPGLAAFSEADAGYFFGRELEIEEMWKRLRRPQLYGLIGPSGAGKSSFLRAGLLSVTPAGWSTVVATPGRQPFSALARALVPKLSGDTEALQLLVDSENPDSLAEALAAWRKRHDQALVVIDQFEELFTLTPPEVQTQFAELLGRLALAADVHVLLSMRDDFLFYCSEQPALSPMFSELTPLRAPTGSALRRALVQPALKCGYRFEDDSLIDEMLQEVGQERGALPMLAFAAARLWEQRERETGLLTREAYERTGGIGDALAQHSERTLEQIGKDNLPLVREVLRNLMTSQGTRAARTRDELLSVFSPEDASAAEGIIDTLVDNRLLTSYEVPFSDEQEAPEHRIEIVHESLLSRWPRLVRWRTQDQEGALLRDQLRQAAQMWEERGRPEDLLWTGTSYNEYELWRDRYSGGLSAAEESFADAMASHAEQSKRRRRTAVTAIIAALVLGLAIVGSFWRQAATQRDRAEREKLRAEGSQLLALAQLELEDNPTAAFAYALASLERADERATRTFALEILSTTPLPFLLDTAASGAVDFSPDGRWLAAGFREGELKLWPSSGGEPQLLGAAEGPLRGVRVSTGSDAVVSLDHENEIATIRAIPGGDLLRTISLESATDILLGGSPQRLLTFVEHDDRTRVQSWPLDGGEPELLGNPALGLDGWYERFFSWGLDVDPTGRRLAYIPMNLSLGTEANGEVFVLPIEGLNGGRRQLAARHPMTVLRAKFHPDGRHLATGDVSGTVRLWDLESESLQPLRVLGQLPGYINSLSLDGTGSKLAAASASRHVAVWDLVEGPPDAAPTRLGVSPANKTLGFHPSGDWLATASGSGVKLWPLRHRHATTLAGHEDRVADLDFVPGRNSLVSVSADGTVRLWPLSPTAAGRGRILFDSESVLDSVAVDPAGEQLLVASGTGRVWWVPLNGSPPRELGTLDSEPEIAISSRYAAAMGTSAGGRILRIWELGRSESRDIAVGDEILGLAVAVDGQFMSLVPGGLGKWNLVDGKFEIVRALDRSIDFSQGIFLTDDFRSFLASGHGAEGEAVLFDLETGEQLQLDAHGPDRCGQLDAKGGVVLTWPCDGSGSALIGTTTGEAPHLLPGLEPGIRAISRDGRWVADANDSEIRLLPIPDLSREPRLSMPQDELLTTLRSLTNLRVVADPESETGWSLEVGPFSGFEEVPTR